MGLQSKPNQQRLKSIFQVILELGIVSVKIVSGKSQKPDHHFEQVQSWSSSAASAGHPLHQTLGPTSLLQSFHHKWRPQDKTAWRSALKLLLDFCMLWELSWLNTLFCEGCERGSGTTQETLLLCVWWGTALLKFSWMFLALQGFSMLWVCPALFRMA